MKKLRPSPARFIRASVLGAASSLLLAACSSGTETRDEDDPLAGLPEAGEIKLQLTRAADCGDLLAQVQRTILGQLAQRAEQLRAGQGSFYDGRDVAVPGGGPVGRPVPQGNGATDDGAEAEGPLAPPSSPTGGSSDPDLGGDASDPAPNGNPGGGFSGTTVQIKDVDEADIVKTDGDRIYLLHGGTLFALNGWPANATEILGSTLIEGTPSEMFVRDGKAIVFSTIYQDLGAEIGEPLAAADYYYGSSGYTKLTVLDVSGNVPTVLRESYVEGGYVSARRHDGIVRAVVQDGFKVPPLGNPAIEYTDLFGQPFPQADIDAQVDAWLERTVRSVQATELGDWLPREFERTNGVLSDVEPRCADYYSPDPRLIESGVTSVVSLDLDAVDAPLGGATILGRAERVYANESVVLVTQSDYRFGWEPDAREQTIIHRFDISGPDTSYTASGPVAGSIHNQFSLDEQAGIIRVSTTERPPWNAGIGIPVPPVTTTEPAPVDDIGAARPAPMPVPQGPINRVVTLETQGTGLVQLGATEGFGQNEQIFATRFIGDRGYVVTFERTDPLFVVDLANPANPEVVGELVIPGFSDYLYPLGDNHLFAIGRDATDEGVVRGLALQIFDVSDPTNPLLAHKYPYPDVGASPANIDHRAISFHPDRGVVAFPFQDYTTGEATLEIFEISAADGLLRLGGMGMGDTAVDFEQCLVNVYGYDPASAAEVAAQTQNDPEWRASLLAGCRGNQHFRRGLFRDDFVYGVSNTGVFVYDLGGLSAGAVDQVSLPPEVYKGTGAYEGGGALPTTGGVAPPTSASGGSAGMMGSATPDPAAVPPEASEDDAADSDAAE